MSDKTTICTMSQLSRWKRKRVSEELGPNVEIFSVHVHVRERSTGQGICVSKSEEDGGSCVVVYLPVPGGAVLAIAKACVYTPVEIQDHF